MEELTDLRRYIQRGQYDEALTLVDELEEMSREDKLNKIYGHAVILFIHLIERAAEKTTTRSGEVSIFQAADQVKRINQRRKAGGCYASRDELREILEDAFELAAKRASLEAFEGQYSEQEIAAQLQQASLIDEALECISALRARCP